MTAVAGPSLTINSGTAENPDGGQKLVVIVVSLGNSASFTLCLPPEQVELLCDRLRSDASAARGIILPPGGGN